MIIKKRWWDRTALWRVGRIVLLITVIYICFGFCIGFKRNESLEIKGMRDGDLIIYEKIWQDYTAEDVVLVDRDGLSVCEYGAMNGGVIKGRVIAVIRVRNFIDE